MTNPHPRSWWVPASERSRWLTLIVRCVGILFLISGAAKIPMPGKLAQTIASVLGSGTGASLLAALLVIVTEIAGGAALSLCRRVRTASAMLAGLTLVFIAVLYPAAVEHRPLVCNCFGILGISLPSRIELALDMVLFDLLLAAVMLWPADRKGLMPAGRKLAAAAVIVAAICIQGALLGRTLAAWEDSSPELHAALSFAAERSPSNHIDPGQRAMVFLIDFADFTCPLCFEDFLALVDSLRGPAPSGTRWRALALMKEGGAERLSGGNRLQRWASDTGIPFPLLLVPDSVFAAAGFRKSMVAVLDESGQTVLHAELPMGPGRRAEALRVLAE